MPAPKRHIAKKKIIKKKYVALSLAIHYVVITNRYWKKNAIPISCMDVRKMDLVSAGITWSKQGQLDMSFLII